MPKIGAENLCIYVFLSLLLFEHLSKFHVSKNYGAQKIGFSADYLTAHLRDRWLFCSRELLVHEKRFIFGGENSFRFSATAQMRETLAVIIRTLYSTRNMLCKIFKQLSIYTWTQIRRSRRVNYQLKEETLTDIIILELKRRNLSQIFTKEFTKHQEGVNGADWEWWFNFGTQWIGFRVQAKIININSNGFEHIHFRNRNTGVYQCDKLIQNALSHSIPRIPIYCLYLQTPDLSLLTRWTCGTFPQNRRLWGCSLMSAFQVKKLRTSNLKLLRDLESFLRPWHCLVCCSGFGGSTKIENIDSYWQNNLEIDQTFLDELGLEVPKTFVTDSPPKYVLQILKDENNSEVQPPDEDIDGVIVFALSNES